MRLNDNPLDLAITDKHREKAQALIDQGYKQTSRRHRLVSRVLPGKTALEAMEEIDPDYVRDLHERMERMAADHYRRMHADHQGDQEQLDIQTFVAYRALGGESSW